MAIEKKIKIPQKIGFMSLAILIGLAEGVVIGASGILEGPKSNIGRAYDKTTNRKTLMERYEDLKNFKSKSARTVLWRLTRKGLIEKRDGNYFLTTLGLEFLKRQKKKSVESKWDGKWRIIMFDIPEKIKTERQRLRSQLLSLNYHMLQKSVFIGKQPLKREIMEEIIQKDLNKHVRLITVGEIDDESVLENFEIEETRNV